MISRIEIATKVNDTKSSVLKNKLVELGFPVSEVKVYEIYTISKDFDDSKVKEIGEMLSNPVSQEFKISKENSKTESDEKNKVVGFFPDFDFALEIGFLPGVTDNVATTARESIEDRFKTKFQEGESIHNSTLILLNFEKNLGDQKEQTQEIGHQLANSLIQRIHIKSKDQFQKDSGMDFVVPKVVLESHPQTDEVNLDISEEQLLKLGKEGILNPDGTRRGPLALEKDYLVAIKNYFQKEGRNPTDIELESLAQTWSEHCKHTIFAAEIDEVKDGLYKHYIKRATNEIRKKKGENDFCVSVFSDNAGGIIFDEDWIITDKAETHNSPSALDPFGGAVTGIVGVNRDCLGFGKGAKPIINKYGFCIGDPDDFEPIYRDAELDNKALPPRRILEGIVEGVNQGGNCSGIPTPQGFIYVDDGYKGKPLVFVGTVGLIPRKVNGKNSWEKKAQAGDKIVVVGGRVGQDGIHGATFSSEALSAGSPATAVQIGDPITQKKLSDAIVKEARDLDLYSSITDCGAGGISCSVAEMARECGGCAVELDQVPLKYPNLEPWKIWISESQERMTFAVPENKLQEFQKLMERHGVESTVIGEFTDSGRCVVNYLGEKIMDLEMDFLHDGLPDKVIKTTYESRGKKQYWASEKAQMRQQSKVIKVSDESNIPEPKDLTSTLKQILSRKNICSYEFISRQYDHNVQGNSVLKPLQGKGFVNGPTSITKPFPSSEKGIICSQGINPLYSEIDTYHMTAAAIDTAIRNIIAVGGTIDHLALMDNFCWCSSTEPERLGQLKLSAQACYDYALEYETPYISGKDSMFNDFKGFNKNADPIKISIAPTLLISSIGVLDDVTKAVSLDPKIPGDLVYVLGDTFEEMGGSEYFSMLEDEFRSNLLELEISDQLLNSVPKVDTVKAKKLYRLFREATEKRLIASALSPAIGGLGATLAKKAIAGRLGMDLDLTEILNQKDSPERLDFLLFSESQSRFVVTIDPNRRQEFEDLFKEVPLYQIGQITEDPQLKIKIQGENKVETSIQDLDQAYRQTFKNY